MKTYGELTRATYPCQALPPGRTSPDTELGLTEGMGAGAGVSVGAGAVRRFIDERIINSYLVRILQKYSIFVSKRIF